jgi:hydroxymethylglutaryl-CoA reductase (NADPH)
MDLKMNRVRDRRQSTRWMVDSSDAIVASFRVGGKTIQGQVTSIGKNGLLMAVEDDSSGLGLHIETDSSVHVTINGPAEDSEVYIGNLLVQRSREGDGSFVELFLVPGDDDAKALLWAFTYQVENRYDTVGLQERISEDEALKIPGRGHYTEASRQERIQFIRDFTQRPMERLNHLGLIPERLSSNIENLVGSVEIPVGLGGPLLFNGQKAKGVIYAPFATTEGALVASVTRGATAMTRSGGVNTRVLKQQMLRVPFWRFHNLAGAVSFSSWIRDHISEVRKQVSSVSRFANLVELEPLVSGAAVHVRFIYETGDAAGQNMTTTCTWHACMWILEQLKKHPSMHVEHFMIDGNVSGDKKVNHMSFLQGRGMRVTADCYLYEEDLQKILKVKGVELERAFRLISQGALRTGMIGLNVNIANVIAAIFTATGQDIACVHESSLGVLNIESVEGGIYASLLLPSLIVGTVGGGTSLPDQNQYLQMIGCSGASNARKLAEVVAGYCLALDLSTLGALASGQFAIAHEKLGRNRPIQTLKLEELNTAFFQKILAQSPLPIGKKVAAAKHLTRNEEGNSIITELTSRRLSKLMGHYPITLTMDDDSDMKTMVKIKPVDSEVLLMMNSVASMCHPVLAKAFRNHHQSLGFLQSHRRELAIYRQTDQRFVKHAPLCYGTVEDPSREIFLVVLENIEGIGFMNTANRVDVWGPEPMQAVVEGLAALHSIWWKREAELKNQTWLGNPLTADSMVKMTELWDAFSIHAAQEFPEWFDPDLLQQNAHLIQSLPVWWKELESMPRTLIYNDFNPRNIGLRHGPKGLSLCAYDWELATLQVPQHDLAEFMLFSESDQSTVANIEHWVEEHRKALMEATGDTIDPGQWKKGFALSLRDLMIHRVPLYIMAHTLHHYKFIRRITETGRHLLRITESWI